MPSLRHAGNPPTNPGVVWVSISATSNPRKSKLSESEGSTARRRGNSLI